MIYSFVVGQKLILSRQGKRNWYSDSVDTVFTVNEVWNDDDDIDIVDGAISDETGEIIYKGTLNREHFDYYGVHVNHEILDLINRQQVKSFQAILEDGRIVHLSCLN